MGEYELRQRGCGLMNNISSRTAGNIHFPKTQEYERGRELQKVKTLLKQTRLWSCVSCPHAVCRSFQYLLKTISCTLAANKAPFTISNICQKEVLQPYTSANFVHLPPPATFQIRDEFLKGMHRMLSPILPLSESAKFSAQWVKTIMLLVTVKTTSSK